MRSVHADRLFIGNAHEARDLQLLYKHRIDAVVDLAADEAPAQLARELIYYRVPLMDGDGNSAATVALAVRTLMNLLAGDWRILVACSAGMSRSPAIAAAGIALCTGRFPDDVLREIVAGAPQDVSPSLWGAVKQTVAAMPGRGTSRDG